MKCERCGAEMGNDKLFCPSCGQTVLTAASGRQAEIPDEVTAYLENGKLSCPICGAVGQPTNRTRCWSCGVSFAGGKTAKAPENWSAVVPGGIVAAEPVPSPAISQPAPQTAQQPKASPIPQSTYRPKSRPKPEDFNLTGHRIVCALLGISAAWYLIVAIGYFTGWTYNFLFGLPKDVVETIGGLRSIGNLISKNTGGSVLSMFEMIWLKAIGIFMLVYAVMTIVKLVWFAMFDHRGRVPAGAFLSYVLVQVITYFCISDSLGNLSAIMDESKMLYDILLQLFFSGIALILARKYKPLFEK